MLRARLARRYELDLAALLNALRRPALELVADAHGLPKAGSVGDLRMRLWRAGALAEAGGDDLVGTAVQPRPIVLRGKLVQLAEGSGVFPPAPALPRPVPAPAPPPRPKTEPHELDELLARADDLVGVRLGPASRDKGALGAKVAALLGVREDGRARPDWRGEVEIKVVPVVRDRAGGWRVCEDPAVSMEGVSPLSKLGRVLWVARVADAGDSPVLSWFFQDEDPRARELARAHLHTRPKGGAGAKTRGWYLHKRYFVLSGFLRSLNG